MAFIVDVITYQSKQGHYAVVQSTAFILLQYLCGLIKLTTDYFWAGSDVYMANHTTKQIAQARSKLHVAAQRWVVRVIQECVGGDVRTKDRLTHCVYGWMMNEANLLGKERDAVEDTAKSHEEYVLGEVDDAVDDAVGTHVQEFRETPLSEAEMESLRKSGHSGR